MGAFRVALGLSCFKGLCWELVETDNWPTAALPLRILVAKMSDISTRQIFFTAHAGILSRWTGCTNIIPTSPNLIVLSCKLGDLFQRGCSRKTQEIVLFKLKSSSVLRGLEALRLVFIVYSKIEI